MLKAPRMSDASSPRTSPARAWIGRLAGIIFGLALAWLLAEVLLRALFFALPPRLQLVLAPVHVTPFSERRLLPGPIWQPDIDYLTIARPVTDFEQFGSAEVRFTVTTEQLWGQRGAFRTRQEMVDRTVDGVVVGDSFAFCFTDAADCWVDRLAQQTGRNLINLGVVSTGSVAHGRVLQDFGLPLKPPLALWQWYGNDANEDYGLAQLRGEAQTPPGDDTPAAPERSWLEENSAVYVLIQMLLGQDNRYAASLQFLDQSWAQDGDVRLGFGRSYLWGAFDLSRPQNAEGWQLSQEALLSAQEQVEGYGGHLVIALMPTKEQVYRDLAEPLIGADHMALLDANYQAMLDFCAAEKLTCLDPLPMFQERAAAGEQLYYTTDIHLNARGNAALADWLAAWLAENPGVFTLESR